MTCEIKRMIAGCIDQMSRGACGGCERRNSCASIFNALGFDRTITPRRPSMAPCRDSAGNAFLAFVARLMVGSREQRPWGHKSAFRHEVELRIEPLLGAGVIRIEQLAGELGFSRQTLYRRLKAEGVTFEELLDGVRRRHAVRFMREEGLSVKDAAYRLGFSDPSAFSRAFKRWTGVSPGKIRRH